MYFYSFQGLGLLIPVILFSLWAQWKVKSSYAKFAKASTRSGLSGADVAHHILRDSGVETPGFSALSGAPACAIEPIAGEMTDHYDPRDHTLRLSQGVYGGRSIAALGIAAHEAGHAIQHANMYAPLMWRNAVYPISSIASSLAWPLLFLGFFVHPMLIDVAIALYIFAVFFTVITLPVEFDASRRALRALSSGGYLTEDELAGARKVLSAAAMTYVAAAAMAIVQLVRMFLMRRD